MRSTEYLVKGWGTISGNGSGSGSGSGSGLDPLGGRLMTHAQVEKTAETNKIFGWQTACRWQDMSRKVNMFATRWFK
jgi:hypothetical protein